MFELAGLLLVSGMVLLEPGMLDGFDIPEEPELEAPCSDLNWASISRPSSVSTFPIPILRVDPSFSRIVPLG